MEIELNGYANLSQIRGELARVQAEINKTKLAADALWASTSKGGIISPKAGAAIAASGRATQQAFDLALASSAAFRVEQMKVNSATDMFTKNLNRQKITLQELQREKRKAHQFNKQYAAEIASGQKKEMKTLQRLAYEEQIRAQKSIVSGPGGKDVASSRNAVSLATSLNTDRVALENLGNKMIWHGSVMESWGQQMQNQGKNAQWAGRQLMVGLSLPIVAIGAAAGKMAYDLDKGLTQITKVYDTEADMFSENAEQRKAARAELDAVEANSIKLVQQNAKMYAASMQDTLAIEQQLAASGLKGAELYESTTAAQRAALLGELDYQSTVKTTIALQSIFRMSAAKTAETWDYMNSIENATSLTMQDLSDAIPIAGQVIDNLGGNVQELGTLLTAMKEQGVPAVQAANALKTSVSRIYTPSKQVQSVFENITGKSLPSITEGSQGLTDVFTRLYEATKDLTDNDRAALFNKLFGAQQAARLSALTKGMGNLTMGIGQVSKAQEIAASGAEAWAKTSEFEVNRLQESASFKFKSAVEQIKGSLAEMGEPFLAVGAKVLNVINVIIGAFNALPKSTKNIISLGAILVAVVGPLYMLYGLTKNFVGTMVNLGGKFLQTAGASKKFGGTLEIMSAEQRAAAEYAKILARDLGVVGQSAMTAEQQLMAYTQSMIYAQKVGRGELLDALGIPQSPAAAGLPPNKKYSKYGGGMVVDKSRKEQEQEAYDKIKGDDRYTEKEKRAFAAEAVAQRNVMLAERETAAKKATAAEQAKITAETDATEQAEQRRAKASRITQGAIAAGSVAMVATMVSSNKVVDSIAKWAIVASTVLPIVQAIRNAWNMQAVIEGYKKVLALAKATAVAQALGNAGSALRGRGPGINAIGSGTVRGQGIRQGGRVLAARGAAALGALGITPMGAAVGAVATIATIAGVAFYKWRKGIAEARKEALRMKGVIADAAANAGDMAAKITGASVVAKQIGLRSNNPNIGTAQLTPLDAASKKYEFTDNDKKDTDAEQAREDYNAMDAQQKQTAAIAVFRDELIRTKGDLDAAKVALQAWYMAMDDSAPLDAGSKVNKLVNSYAALKASLNGIKKTGNGEFSTVDLDLTTLNNLLDEFGNAEGQENVDKAAKNLATHFIDAFNKAPIDRRDDLVNRYIGRMTDQVPELMNDGPVKAIIDALNPKDAGEFVAGIPKVMKEFNAAVDRYISDGSTQMTTEEQAEFAKNAVAGLAPSWADDPSVAKWFGIEEGDLENYSAQIEAVLVQLAGKSETEIARITTAYAQASAAMSGQGIDIKGPGDIMNNPIFKFATAATEPEKYKAFGAFLVESSDELKKIQKTLSETPESDWTADQIAQNEDLKTVLSETATETEKAAALTRLLGEDAAMTAVQSGRAFLGMDSWRKGLKWFEDSAIDAAKKGKSFQAVLDAIRQEANIEITATLKAPAVEGGAAWGGMLQMVRDSSKAAWQTQISGMQEDFAANQSAAQNALQNRQQAASNGLDNKQEKRRDKWEKYYDSRIEKINETIEAEQKAEEIRQRIFEAETKRIERMKDLANSDIDINVALQTGDYDEAAKLQNDQNAMTDGWAMDDAAEISGDRSDTRIDKLGDKADKLEKEKQAKMEQLAKIEKAEKDSLARRQAAQTQYLQETQAAQKKSFDEALRYLQAFTPKNEAEIQQHLADVEAKYGTFGGVISDIGNEWAGNWRKSLKTEVDLGIKEMQDNAEWQKILETGGRQAVMAMIVKPMGFKNIKDMVKALGLGDPYDGIPPTNSAHHGGGWIDAFGGKGSGRAGYTGGKSMQERWTLAEHGEFMVKREAAQKNKHLLNFINNGGDAAKFGIGGGDGTSPGIGNYPASVGAKAVLMSIAEKLKARGRNVGANAGPGADQTTFAPGDGKNSAVMSSGYITRGNHDNQYDMDIGVAVGTPVKAVRSGKVTASYDIPGYEPRAKHGGLGYRSYGRVIKLAHDTGGYSLYAHLSKRGVSAGQHVAGGSTIGLSGNTGNSSGPHLHFEATPDASAYFPSVKQMRKGGYTLTDGLAQLHKKESVLTAPLTESLKNGITNLENGVGNTYNLTMQFNGDPNDKEAVAEFVMGKIKKHEQRKPRSSRVGGSK